MKLSRLIERLQDFALDAGEDAEVVLAIQPSWPFEHGIGDIVVVHPSEAAAEEGEAAKIFISEAGQTGYLPSAAADELGW